MLAAISTSNCTFSKLGNTLTVIVLELAHAQTVTKKKKGGNFSWRSHLSD